ncbi:hypothetical protein K504DRAFT_366861 [Pleomassaria siparia CBS 279.74]|uniref:COP9 signalosome complex subunit 6 n=1 Tax=Pleomassaria siparia CBS 279.74 TaxID=1314801 RepID=A0A6G1KQP9_9PLEO|nr:hypothetical protein K504DRAFT_366861 [Pleomassaria siparia CBS 279.74]
MAEASGNPLLSTARASDTSSAVQLHPLVLLTISDCITRHTMRQLEGPVVGAILGQQSGQEITMEVAFQAKLLTNEDGDVILDDEWFSKRVEDYRDVHKAPQFELVGWFTLGPASGPQPYILPIHTRISEVYTESPILLLFHPADAASEATAAGKLPLTLYESVFENATGGPNEKAMDIDGAAQPKALKFKELAYTVETGEAEMIGVDSVARGGGNATAVNGAAAAAPKEASKVEDGKKGKGKVISQKEKHREEMIDESAVLDADDEEILSTLTAKTNAIRMLSRRIALLRAYMSSLPPSYLSDPSLPFDTPVSAEQPLPLDHSILRSISAMLSRISILAPPDAEAFTLESHQESSDVQLIALLSSITNSVSAAKELGRKSHIVEHAKQQGRKGGINMMMSGGSGYDGAGSSYYDGEMGGEGKRAFGSERW